MQLSEQPPTFKRRQKQSLMNNANRQRPARRLDIDACLIFLSKSPLSPPQLRIRTRHLENGQTQNRPTQPKRMTPLRCANAPSVAGSFVRIASRSFSSSAPTAARTSATAPLEFLVPRHALRMTTGSTASPATITWRSRQRPAALSRWSAAPASQASRRAFSVSASRRATVCVQHPVEDEDGNMMMLEITSRAAKVCRSCFYGSHIPSKNGMWIGD